LSRLTEIGKAAKICFHERQDYGSSDSGGQSRQQQGTPRMTDPNQVAIIVGEPNWAPLERAVPATELENFMYMGRAGEIELYKHRITRRYLNIGRNSQTFYQYLNGEYTEISQASALEYVRG